MLTPAMKVSLVTPVLNGAAYLDGAIRSVLSQNYTNLEYIVIDGGSTDGSLDIVHRHETNIAWAESAADSGMYDALNKGFSKSTGEIMGWLNSDDMQLPWTLDVVAEIFSNFPQIEWLTSLYPLSWDERGRAVRLSPRPSFSKASFFRGENFPGMTWRSSGWIQQESTFWRRTLWEKVGGRLEDTFRLAGDFDLWARFYQQAELYAVTTPLAGFRRHGRQLTAGDSHGYRREALKSFLEHGGAPSGRMNSTIRELSYRLGFKRGGKLVAFDFSSMNWKILPT